MKLIWMLHIRGFAVQRDVKKTYIGIHVCSKSARVRCSHTTAVCTVLHMYSMYGSFFYGKEGQREQNQTSISLFGVLFLIFGYQFQLSVSSSSKMAQSEEFDFEKLVNAAGCGPAYYKAEECLQEYDRDMRMCQEGDTVLAQGYTHIIKTN